MKKLITAFVLLCATSAFAQPTTMAFQSYSGVGVTNTLNTCAVLSGKLFSDSSFNVESIANYAVTTKAGTSSSITLSAGSDYKIACFQTSSPKDAVVMKLLFDGGTTYFPMSSLLYRQR